MAQPAATFLEWATNQPNGSFWAMVSRNITRPTAIGPLVVGEQPEVAGLEFLLSSVQLGLLSGVLLVLYVRHKIVRWSEELADSKTYSDYYKSADLRRAIFVLVTFVEFLVLSPLLGGVLLMFKCYRTAVGVILRRRHGTHFKGLLDGADVVWAIEKENSRGMINIMANIEEPLGWKRGASTSAELLLTLRKRITSRLLRRHQPHPKMFWKRNVELGYYFWTDRSELTVEDYIRYMDLIPLRDDQQYVEEEQLRSLMSAINNRHLPANHTSSWEVLVGRQPLFDEAQQVLKYPILFRVHHSLGDGVALLRLLLEAIVDREVPSRWKRLSKLKVINLDYIIRQQTRDSCVEHKTISERFRRKLPSAEQLNLYKAKVLTFLWTIYMAPAFFHDVSTRHPDDNCIRASTMANEKVVSWIHESHCGNTRWVEIIKRTKQQMPGARFSDVFLTALSSSLFRYFESRGSAMPKNLTVVLPARIEKESHQLKLHNRFSVALQTLPIAPELQMEDANRHRVLMKRLTEVKQFSDILRSSPDYMINYWIMSKMTCLFPEDILRRILTSAHSTLAISNLPGPQHKPRIHGYELKNLSFWIPNIGTTAVGLTLLTYGGKLQLGILADRAVIQSEHDAHTILTGVVEEIERMGQLLNES